MRNRQHLALAHPKWSREPRPKDPLGPAPSPQPEPSRDPIYDEVAEIMERAAEAVEQASQSLRAVARMLRG